MEKQEFEKIIINTINAMPERIKKLLDNVQIVVDDYPSLNQLKKVGQKSKYALLGIYEGVPKTKRGVGYANVLPDKITIFQKNIERIAKTDQEIAKIVKRTVYHEIAHHFGFDEEGARRIERKNG